MDLLDTVYVIDQGTDRAKDHPGFADAAKKLGDRLQVIEQGNLGGSGGFARSMDETVRAGRSDYLLIMDDDVQFDPEGILRAATFADLARRPTIVGGHMFSMYDRSVLHAFAETVAPHNWWWGTAPNTKARHDFGRRNLRNTPWLHRRADSDYNGWWMCLIPARSSRELGLALPVFIKWDDAEYGVRAREHGIPDGVDAGRGGLAGALGGQERRAGLAGLLPPAQPARRRAAALAGRARRRASSPRALERQLQNLLSMQYSTVALRLLAIEDVLTGPAHLHRELGTKMKQLREVRARFTDAQGAADLESFPPARRQGARTS